jgi:hypothetical protein
MFVGHTTSSCKGKQCGLTARFFFTQVIMTGKCHENRYNLFEEKTAAKN